MTLTASRSAEQVREKSDVLRNSLGYKSYTEVRDYVLRCMDLATNDLDAPSDYWNEELAGFEYLLDANPLLVEKLRHHCYHITGIKDYDYREHHQERSSLFEAKLRTLKTLDKWNLIAPEPDTMGGFGYMIDGGRYNIDTLKFYEVMLGLRHSGALDGMMSNPTAQRPVVLEVGGGWGGFAYQFKTRFPNSTYVIVDLPGTLLFSGSYLKTLFPASNILLADSPEQLRLSREQLAQYDFILLPHTLWSAFEPDVLDIALNMISFQEMTGEQVDAYVAKMAQLNCPICYSLNRDNSPHNPQIGSVSGIMAKYYQLKEVKLLNTPYTKLSAKEEDPMAINRVVPFGEEADMTELHNTQEWASLQEAIASVRDVMENSPRQDKVERAQVKYQKLLNEVKLLEQKYGKTADKAEHTYMHLFGQR